MVYRASPRGPDRSGKLSGNICVRRVLQLGAVAAVTLVLAGCFQPMYAPQAGLDPRGELRAISIEPVPGRLGHYLTEELRFLLNGTGEEPTPRYRLFVTFSQSGQTSLVDTVTGRATSNSLSVRANYKLLPSSGGAPVTEGYVISLADYDRGSNRFANVRAARDAEIRNAKAMADQIRTRLASTLASR